MTPDWDRLSAEVLKLACEIQQIPAPTFHEEKRAAFVIDRFHLSGVIDAACDSAGNVIGHLPGSVVARPLIITAHMDTVFPLNFPLTLDCIGDRATGPGIGDNALGLAAVLSIRDILNAAGIAPTGDLWLVGTTGEEGLGDLRGIREITARFKELVVGYISIEGIGLGSILHRGVGVERYRVRANTHGGHSWVDYGSPSAIHELTALATRLASQHLPRKPRSTFNIGLIQGGTSVNSIAANAWMDVDLRSENAQGLSETSRQFVKMVENASNRNVRFDLEKIGSRPAAEIPREHGLVRLAARALGDVGILPQYDIASTEANEPLSRGFPAVTLGISTGNRAHTAEEYIDISPISKGLRQLASIVSYAWA